MLVVNQGAALYLLTNFLLMEYMEKCDNLHAFARRPAVLDAWVSLIGATMSLVSDGDKAHYLPGTAG